MRPRLSIWEFIYTFLVQCHSITVVYGLFITGLWTYRSGSVLMNAASIVLGRDLIRSAEFRHTSEPGLVSRSERVVGCM